MPSHKEIKKYREYWAFLNHLADAQDNKTEFPTDTARIFADWLQDHGDARHHVFRAAVAHHFDNSKPTHPELAYGEYPGQGRDDWLGPINGAQSEHAYAPTDAYQDNVHTWTRMERVYRPAGVSVPAVTTRIHIPRTVSTTGKHRQLDVYSPMTTEAVHAFIDAMPRSKTKALWKAKANQRFPLVTKLARIDPPGGPLGPQSVLVKVPVPLPDSDAPKPQAPKPQVQSTFFLPG